MAGGGEGEAAAQKQRKLSDEQWKEHAEIRHHRSSYLKRSLVLKECEATAEICFVKGFGYPE